MVVIDDFRKQILYQKLNLGYDCTFCKRKFYSKREQLQHLQKSHLNTPKKENIECPRCGKVFGHAQIYQLHQQIHALSDPESIKLTNIKNEISGITSENGNKTIPSKQCQQTKEKQRVSNSNSMVTTKKAVGLTKVRMEDCLRCDACSCIYIDRNDYYKHMRNFHKVNVQDDPESIRVARKSTSVPKTTATTIISRNAPDASPSKSVFSPKKKCRSCCKQCRGAHISKGFQQPLNYTARIIQRACSNELFKFSMLDNIKDRWSKMVSQRLFEPEKHLQVNIKPDPDAMELDQSNIIDSDEMSHLLSQVEVKIKTEPIDER